MNSDLMTKLKIQEEMTSIFTLTRFSIVSEQVIYHLGRMAS